VIHVKQLSLTYPRASQPAVRNLNFEVQSGEIFGFLGPSGAGKSTTQKILIGLLRDYQGQVRVLGRDLPKWGADLYERIGVSFEFPNHFLKLTAAENLRYFGRLYNRPVRSPAHLLGLVGLQEDGEQLVAQYSKGMKNRLSVARALLHDPELLFLDEPTTGLDPVNARRIKDLIQAQKQAGRTIFLTTHNMSVAEELCDRVAFLVDGQIRLIDSPHALKLAYGQQLVRVEYLERQDGAGERLLVREFPLNGLGQSEAFQHLLNQHVLTIHSREATLEEIFIQVTGTVVTGSEAALQGRVR
jgi:fluoroquinolone transport system ATP-binding protein